MKKSVKQVCVGIAAMVMSVSLVCAQELACPKENQQIMRFGIHADITTDLPANLEPCKMCLSSNLR